MFDWFRLKRVGFLRVAPLEIAFYGKQKHRGEFLCGFHAKKKIN